MPQKTNTYYELAFFLGIFVMGGAVLLYCWLQTDTCDSAIKALQRQLSQMDSLATQNNRESDPVVLKSNARQLKMQAAESSRLMQEVTGHCNVVVTHPPIAPFF